MYLLFDIGGTKSRFAVTRDGKDLGRIKTFDTPQEWGGVRPLLDQVRQDLLGGEGVEGVVGGIAGQVDDQGILHGAPHLDDWRGKNVGEVFKEAFEVSAEIYNDSLIAGLGEAVLGAGKGKRVVAYVGVGTGVGGVRIVEGEIDKNSFGFEIGHHVIDVSQGRTLEELVSGSGFENLYGRKPRQDDADEKVWREVGERMGAGFYNTALFWSPDVIVLGGTMIHKSPEVMTSAYLETFKKLMEERELPVVPLVASEFGDEAGLMGALSVVRKIEKGK